MEEDKEKEEPIAAGMDEGDEEKDVSAENETKEAVREVFRIKKRHYVGIFPTWSDPPSPHERPCHKKILRFILCFKAS